MPDKTVTKFRWVDKQGIKHRVEDMTTQHVFMSLRMIWNHSAPEAFKIRPYIKYKYRNIKPEYWISAVRALGAELTKRTDMNDYMIRCLKFMKDNSMNIPLLKNAEQE